MKPQSKYTLAKTYLLTNMPKVVCLCEREVSLAEFDMSEADLCFRKCKKCHPDNSFGWTAYYDSLKFDTKNGHSVKKHRMYNSFMTNARLLYKRYCIICGYDKTLWSYKDNWARMPYSIYANKLVFASGHILCAGCVEDVMHNKPNNNKGQGFLQTEVEVEVDEHKELLKELKKEFDSDSIGKLYKKGGDEPNDNALDDDEVIYKSDAVVTSQTCQQCKQVKKNEEFAYYRSDRGDYLSCYCRDCRKLRQKEYNRTRNLSESQLAYAKKIHQENIEFGTCYLCANRTKGTLEYYNLKTLRVVKYNQRPWLMNSNVYLAHKECIKFKKLDDKRQFLLFYEKQPSLKYYELNTKTL